MQGLWQSIVRDYEVDLQGIVNNANYFHYMEHARHLMIKELGLNFNQMHQIGFDLVLIQSTVNFRRSLVSGDSFCVQSTIYRKGKLRIGFMQKITRDPDQALIIDAINMATCLCVKTRKPALPPRIRQGAL